MLNGILEACMRSYLCTPITRESPAVEREHILFDPIIWSIKKMNEDDVLCVLPLFTEPGYFKVNAYQLYNDLMK